MAEQVAQPRLTHHVFQQLFHSGSTLSKLRDTVGQGQLLHPSDRAVGIPGRSLAWKLFLLKDEPLQLPSNEVPRVPIELLRSSRRQFSELLLEKMRAPDGSYDESFVAPGLTIPRRKTQTAINLETNNPLSLHDENPWKAWFAAVDLRKTIQQDVERTFPDMGYFRNKDIQHQLTNVLFLYCAMHPNTGYRQGMHEILAPLFYAIDFDSVAESESSGLDPSFCELCARSWVAADSWALFSSLMCHISHWYEWQEPTSPPSLSRGPINLKPYVSPIIQTCNNIQGELLKSVDPVLYDAMQSAGVEPQIYGLRWLRLLFTREFPMHEAMILWDGLFASSSPIPDIVQWTCVAMLIRIRTKLISSDYSTQLMQLLRYPACPVHDGTPHHILLLIRQATALDIIHTPSAGASLVIENRNLLHIPIEVPEPPVVVRRKGRPMERTHQLSASEHVLGSPPTDGVRQQPSFQLGFPEIARGFLDRGESLSINKTVMNAVSELKRNLPDLASTLVRPPLLGSSSYPLLDERPPTERYTWDHRREFESARELAELRQQNKHLGEAVAWILDTLNRVEEQDGQVQRKQSLESLSYVRDVLSGQIDEIDERRLWGEEEFKRRWEAREASPSVATARAGSPRDSRRFALNAAIPPSVNETLRGFVSSHAARGIPGTCSAPRAPVRMSGSNPFQRVSDGRVVGSDVSGEAGREHWDPLGVLRS